MYFDSLKTFIAQAPPHLCLLFPGHFLLQLLAGIIPPFLENLFPQKHSFAFCSPISLKPLFRHNFAQLCLLFFFNLLNTLLSSLFLLSLKHPLCLNLQRRLLYLTSHLALNLSHHLLLHLLQALIVLQTFLFFLLQSLFFEPGFLLHLRVQSHLQNFLLILA